MRVVKVLTAAKGLTRGKAAIFLLSSCSDIDETGQKEIMIVGIDTATRV